MKKIALILPILSGIMFGSVGVFVRTLYGAGFDNTTVIFSRAFFAAIMLLIFICIKDRQILKLRRQDMPWVLGCAILGMLTTNLCFNVSSTTLSLAFAAVLLSIAPVYTLIISRFIFNMPVTRRSIICVIMTILGCILVSGVIDTRVTLCLAGVICGIVSGISYGLYSIFSRKGTDGGLTGLTITFYCMVIIAIVLAPFSNFGAVTAFITAKPTQSILFLILHSLIVGVLPYLFLTISLKYINPGTASILASCEPVAAMLFGLIFFSEVPTVFGLFGLAITVVALGLLCAEKK